MKIVVVGGTGLIGSQLVKHLKDQHEVVIASPNTGVNTITGEGLEHALKNAGTVVDVSNSPSFADDAVMSFFKTSTENLLKAEKKAGIQHHLALSVVGTNRLQESGYFRAKQVQENLIKESGIPYTIVHATQFFEFAGGLTTMSTLNGKLYLSDAFIQPIASADVASFLATQVVKKPALGIVEIAGPEKLRITDWIGEYLKATNNPTDIVTQRTAPYSGARLEVNTLIPENASYIGKTIYKNWISKPENQK
jgi:uncharacterized protein YbjT (DUF2867 family)